MFDFKEIMKVKQIQEISRVKEVFHVLYHRGPRDLKVEVMEYPDNQYIGIANYAIWSPKQVAPYKSMQIRQSVSAALNDALRGIMSFDTEDIPNEVIFFVSDDDKYFDGNGDLVTKEEINERIKKYQS